MHQAGLMWLKASNCNMMGEQSPSCVINTSLNNYYVTMSLVD